MDIQKQNLILLCILFLCCGCGKNVSFSLKSEMIPRPMSPPQPYPVISQEMKPHPITLEPFNIKSSQILNNIVRGEHTIHPSPLLFSAIPSSDVIPNIVGGRQNIPPPPPLFASQNVQYITQAPRILSPSLPDIPPPVVLTPPPPPSPLLFSAIPSSDVIPNIVGGRQNIPPPPPLFASQNVQYITQAPRILSPSLPDIPPPVVPPPPPPPLLFSLIPSSDVIPNIIGGRQNIPPPPPLFASQNVQYITQAPRILSPSLPDIPPPVILHPPPPPPPPPPPLIQMQSQHEFRDQFPYTWSQHLFKQPIQNTTAVLFKAYNERGFNIKDLQNEDITVTENQIEIQNYTLSSYTEKKNLSLEVVLAIDTQGSMRRYMHLIKENMAYFVDILQENAIDAKFCLVTFRDRVEKVCNKFIEDHPLTPENENFISFLDDLSGLNLGGGGSYKENALGGLLTATQAPWQPNSQRIVILITDALFWVKPFDRGIEALTAPDYPTVLNALEKNNIQVFALTYDYDGFSKNYFEYPSLVEASSGQWFDLKALNSSNILEITDQVKEQIDVFYRLEYIVEESSPLNPFLNLNEREISLTSYFKNIQIEVQNIDSNMSSGKPELQSHWLLESNQPIQVHLVTVDGQLEDNFFIEDNYIVFNQPPHRGSEIYIEYEVGRLIDNVQRHPLVLQSDPQHHKPSTQEVLITSVQVELNGKLASQEDFEIEISSDDQVVQLKLNESVFADHDPFDIRTFATLNIVVSYEITSQHR